MTNNKTKEVYIQFRAKKELRDLLDEYAKEKGWTRSEACHFFVEREITKRQVIKEKKLKKLGVRKGA